MRMNSLEGLPFPLFRRRRSDGLASSSTKSEPFSASSLRNRLRRLSHNSSTETNKTKTEAEEERRDEPPAATFRTSVLGSYEPLVEEEETRKDQVVLKKLNVVPLPKESCGATAILKHSFVMCGALDGDHDDDVPNYPRISEDPSVQESFECVFSSQLEEGLEHEGLWEEEHIAVRKALVSPALLHQTLGNSRRQLSTSLSLTKPRNTFRTGSLVHIGTYDPVADSMSMSPPPTTHAPLHVGTYDQVVDTMSMLPPSTAHTAQESPPPRCHCCSGLEAPKMAPEQWPQRPLLFRPTPGSGMKVKGVRFVNSTDYLWQEGESDRTWVQSLHKHWGRESPKIDLGCPECMILPINNGNEPENESLVVDFRSDLFEGTVLLRLRHSNGSTHELCNEDKGYFAGVNRRYQVVIQGRPLQELSMNDLLTGFRLDRPCGKLPPKWILKSAVRFMSFFAPQMQTNLEGEKPMSLSPLGSAPQLLKVNGNLQMECKQEEPIKIEETLMGVASHAPTTLARAKFRKKAFDKLYVEKSHNTPTLKPENTYTFEFLQHLLNFTDFTVELGSMLGSIPLKSVLDGQALPIMACTPDKKLWSFDVLHEDLMEDTVRHDRMRML